MILDFGTPRNRWNFDYDSSGNLVEIRDAAGSRLLAEYDDTVGLPEESTTTLVYDPTTCNLLAVTDGAGNTTRLGHDAAGNVVRLCDGLGRVATD